MKKLTKAEEQVMQILWDLGEGLVKDVIKEFPEPKPAYNAVSTVMRVLEKKGFVSHKAYGNTYVYKEAVLIYSFVGFQTNKIKGAGEHKVEMERTVYTVSPDYEKKMKMKELQKRKELELKMESMSPEEKKKFKEDLKKKEEMKKQKMKKEAEMEKKAAEGDKEVFYIVEDMPKFLGKSHHTCYSWVEQNLVYPEEAKKKGIEEVVMVHFVVDTRGKVSKAKVKKSADPVLDKAALKTVYAMPDWTPGKQRGKAVSTQFVIPVKFSI